MDDPTFATACELAAAIRDGEVSSEEVVGVHLARISGYDDSRLNAVVTFDEDGAL
jgi:Asp-tRNA(Asn)/Glu-tRNA(Gln) amidotransferase A subunit family amidase